MIPCGCHPLVNSEWSLVWPVKCPPLWSQYISSSPHRHSCFPSPGLLSKRVIIPSWGSPPAPAHTASSLQMHHHFMVATWGEGVGTGGRCSPDIFSFLESWFTEQFLFLHPEGIPCCINNSLSQPRSLIRGYRCHNNSFCRAMALNGSSTH